MKNLMRNLVLCTICVAGLLSAYSCEEDDMIIESNLTKISQTDIYETEGTILSYLSGTVHLLLSPSASTKSDQFKVLELLNDECMDMSDCNWIVKMISIGPAMSFRDPVIVSMNYDMELEDRRLVLEGQPPVIYYWANEEDFTTQTKRETLLYDYDDNNKTINFHIKRTGLFAIGVNVPR